MASNLTCLVSALTSIQNGGQPVQYIVTIYNNSTSPVVVTAVSAFNSDGGSGTTVAGLPLTIPAFSGGVPGSAQCGYSFVYFNYNGNQPRTVTSNVTVYGNDGSVCTCTGGSPQTLIYNPDFPPPFSLPSRLWTNGQLNFAALQNSSLTIPVVMAPQSAMFV